MKDTGRSGDRQRLGSESQVDEDLNREGAPALEITHPKSDEKSGSAVKQDGAAERAPDKSSETAAPEAVAHKSSASRPDKSLARSATSMTTDEQQLTRNEPKPTTAADLPLATGLQSRIGAQLQSLYNDLLTEETPDRFLKLLEELDRKSPPR